jgi:hypothetical protein
MSDQEKNSIPGMLNIKTKEEQVGEVSESKKEQQFYLQANKLEEIKKELFKKLSEIDPAQLIDSNSRQEIFVDFSNKITEMFPEIALFTAEGQKASEFSPKPVEIEHKKTVASLYYLLLLTSNDAPIQNKDDVRFKILVPTFFQSKLNPQVLEEQRKVVNILLGDKNKMCMMASMLAIHDMAKLESVLNVINSIRSEDEQGYTSDHDVALQSLLNNDQKMSEIMPTMAALPKEKQELIKLILKAGSEINIGQIGQALEGNPSQIEAISKVELSAEDIGFWFIENLADTASAAGTVDGSALVMSQESVWNAWKWAVDSLMKVKKEGVNSIEAYLNLLNHEANALNIDFDRKDNEQITSLRICMALQTTDESLYQKVLSFIQDKPNTIIDLFGMEGMTGEQTYRLYYSPSILRKVSQILSPEIAMSFLNKITSTCKNKINSGETLQNGEITFQLSSIDAAINPKMPADKLTTLLDKNLTIDDNLYVKFL